MIHQKMKQGLYVDDVRTLPEAYKGWDVARNYEEAIKLLTENRYKYLSLDHDIASYDESGREMTGYDIALWLAERRTHRGFVPLYITVHSSNPPGVKNIQGVIDRYLSDCWICNGEKGGVKGNDNIVDDMRMCDYCHSEYMDRKQ